MHAKNLIVALALASSSVVEANRPRMYIPRQVKREVGNNAPENQPAPVIEKREPADSFIKSLIDKNSRKQASQEDGVNFDPTLPLGFKKSGPSASAPALIIQPTTSEALTTELAASTDAPTEADTGILLAPSGIVTSKTAAEPAKTTADAVKEPSTEAPKKEETKPAATSDVVAKPATTEKPKEETKPAATTAPAVEESSSAKTPEKKPVVETKTEAPVPVETVTEPAVVETKTEKPVESKTEKPSATKGLLDPVESILTSVLPVASDSKKETKTEEPAVETTEKPKTDSEKETQSAPVETETAKPAEPETTSPAVEKPAPTSKGLLDPVETLLSSVLAEPADSKTKDPTADQTESISRPEETGKPTKDPQRDASKPQTDGQTLPTFSPPADETTAAPKTGETSKDGLLDPVETLLSSVLPNQPDVKTTSPEESSAPVDSQPTSASPNGSEQTVSAAPSTEPETTGPAEIIPTSILPDPTNILPVPTDVTSAVPEASSPVTVSPVVPTTASLPEKSESGSPDVTSFLDPNTKFPQTGSVAPTDAPNTTVPEVTSGIDVTPEPTSEPINGTETIPNVTGEPQTTGAPEPTSVATEEPTNITQSAIPTGAPTNEPSGNTTAPATEPATEPATKPVDTASGSVPTGSPATETDAETNGTATVEPTKPATDVETQSAPATEGEQTSAVAPTDEQPSVAPTSQPPVETETRPEPEPTTLVPTAAVPVTSIRPTATLTNTNNWLPTTIVFEPTSIPAQPSQPTETSTSTGLPANIPRVILPNDPNKPIPEGSVPIQLGFLFPFNYKFLARNTVAAAQLFKYLPKGLADAGGFSKDRILVSKIVPLDTQSQWGYITALAKIHYPENMIDSLQADLITPNSPLYNNDLEIVRNLTSVINTKIDIFGDSDTDNNTDNGNSDDANSGNGDVFGNSGEGDKSAKQKATTAGIAVGAVGLSVMYGAAMFLVARRYKRKKQQGHRRASSIGSSQRSSEMQYTGNGSPALMGGALMSRDFSAYGATHAEQGQVRPGGRDSHGSGRSGMGNSARTAYISAPVAAENSLGWN